MNTQSFEQRRHCMARFFVRLLSSVVGAVFLVFQAGSAFAVEGASSFYLLGQRGQGAAFLPPEGLFFTAPNYLYGGGSEDSEDLPFGGSLAFGVDANIFLTLPTAIWATPLTVLGGDLALTGTFVLREQGEDRA